MLHSKRCLVMLCRVNNLQLLLPVANVIISVLFILFMEGVKLNKTREISPASQSIVNRGEEVSVVAETTPAEDSGRKDDIVISKKAPDIVAESSPMEETEQTSNGDDKAQNDVSKLSGKIWLLVGLIVLAMLVQKRLLSINHETLEIVVEEEEVAPNFSDVSTMKPINLVETTNPVRMVEVENVIEEGVELLESVREEDEEELPEIDIVDDEIIEEEVTNVDEVEKKSIEEAVEEGESADIFVEIADDEEVSDIVNDENIEEGVTKIDEVEIEPKESAVEEGESADIFVEIADDEDVFWGNENENPASEDPVDKDVEEIEISEIDAVVETTKVSGEENKAIEEEKFTKETESEEEDEDDHEDEDEDEDENRSTVIDPEVASKLKEANGNRKSGRLAFARRNAAIDMDEVIEEE